MLEIFKEIIPKEKQHPIFKLLSQPEMEAERKVLESWSEGFIDRDGKFIKEFQRTFESSMWELLSMLF